VGDVSEPDSLTVALVPSSAPNSASIVHAGFVTGTGADGRQETGDVLKNEPAWGQFVGQPHNFPEQPRTCAAQARAATCDGEILARETPGEDASCWNKSGCPEVIRGHLPDVIEKLCSGEVAANHATAFGVNLN
jgi:hypothetical protein